MLNYHKVIGYFAYISITQLLCREDACVIIGSEKKMKDYIQKSGFEDTKYTIRKTRFGEIMQGINLGAAYCFDEEAYNRFYPLAQEEGLKTLPTRFTNDPAKGLDLIRIKMM